MFKNICIALFILFTGSLYGQDSLKITFLKVDENISTQYIRVSISNYQEFTSQDSLLIIIGKELSRENYSIQKYACSPNIYNPLDVAFLCQVPIRRIFFQLFEGIAESGSIYVDSSYCWLKIIFKSHLGTTDTIELKGNGCQVTSIQNFIGEQKEELIKMVDAQGKDLQHPVPGQLVLFLYKNGRIEKRVMGF